MFIIFFFPEIIATSKFLEDLYVSVILSLTVDEDELNSSTEKEGVEIFFFPDESNIKRQVIDTTDLDEPKSIEFEENVMETSQDNKPMNVQVAKDLGDPNTPKSTPKKGKRKKVSVDLIKYSISKLGLIAMLKAAWS